MSGDKREQIDEAVLAVRLVIGGSSFQPTDQRPCGEGRLDSRRKNAEPGEDDRIGVMVGMPPAHEIGLDEMARVIPRIVVYEGPDARDGTSRTVLCRAGPKQTMAVGSTGPRRLSRPSHLTPLLCVSAGCRGKTGTSSRCAGFAPSIYLRRLTPAGSRVDLRR